MPKNLFDVAGRVALVTGGRRGLGKAMTLGLLDAGAKVAVVARTSELSAPDLDDYVRSGDCVYFSADLAVREQRSGLVKQVVDHFGRIDILINNAGVQRKCAAIEYSLDDWAADLEIHLAATLDLSQQAAAYMIEQGSGKIIQLASISSFQGARNIIAYSTAKHGIVGMTKCMANEWACHGINVNAIAPGLFETDMASDVFADPVKTNELKGRVPAGRFGLPADIVGPALFLASDACRHVHGHVLLVDGGWMGR